MEPLRSRRLNHIGLSLAGHGSRRSAAFRKQGEALVPKYCARCHSVGRVGVSPHRGAPAFRALARRYLIEGLEEALGEGICHWAFHMPEFRFNGDHVGATIAYLKSIQER